MRHRTRFCRSRREAAPPSSTPGAALRRSDVLTVLRCTLAVVLALAGLLGAGNSLAANQPPSISNVGIPNVTYFDNDTYQLFLNGNTISDPDVDDLVNVTVVISPADAASFGGSGFTVS